jgi:hypothetical protein
VTDGEHLNDGAANPVGENIVADDEPSRIGDGPRRARHRMLRELPACAFDSRNKIDCGLRSTLREIIAISRSIHAPARV